MHFFLQLQVRVVSPSGSLTHTLSLSPFTLSFSLFLDLSSCLSPSKSHFFEGMGAIDLAIARHGMCLTFLLSPPTPTLRGLQYSLSCICLFFKKLMEPAELGARV